jgi:hypothetical protein
MGRLLWQEGLSDERRTSNVFNSQHEYVVRRKVLKVRYSAFTIRNLNPYESKVFYELLPNNRFVNPNLYIKPVPVPVPVPRTCTCTFLRVTAGSKRTSVQSTSVQALKRLEPAVTRRKPVPVYLYLVPVPCTCTCTSYLYLVRTSYLYLYLYLVPVPVPVPRTCTCTCTSYLLYLYLVRVPIS